MLHFLLYKSKAETLPQTHQGSKQQSVSAAGVMSLRFFTLLFSLGLTAAALTGETETDVDEGHDWDIFDINQAAELDLLEGDIDMTSGRNSIIGDSYRWPTTIPYYLEDSLEMNAKGVILKAFDQYRLKTCIDFTPWNGEKNYISVFKGSGCFSSVGNQQEGKQRLSIGNNCDRLGTVEHEFLHALGFWHEQSRADRDDYVNIMWDRIEPGKEHNFKTYDDKVSSALGVPYDYGSVMHYSKTSFNIGSEPTIVTNIPSFMDVIGQRMGFSASDLTKLNRLYNCTESSTFVDSCDFEQENICGMIQAPGNPKWEQRRSVSGGPQHDFTAMGQCKGKGYFMHFSTASAEPGHQASLESRWLYPKPGAQCLQFFLHNKGAADDVLNIWVREYDKATPSGKLNLFKSISGGVMGSWELHNVDLNVAQKARVVFQAVRGKSPSSGGFSLDDINLSSTKCPQHVWRIRNITSLMATTPAGEKLYSPRFLSPAGYSFQVGAYLNGRSDRQGYIGLYFHLTSGPNDHNLKWPCPWQQATMALMDQHSDIREQMNMHRMVTTDPDKVSSDGTEYYWDDPRKVGSKVTQSDGSFYYRGPGTGTSTFITHSRLRSRQFIKGDDAFLLLSLDDISDLLLPQPLPRSADYAEASAMKAVDQDTPQSTASNHMVIVVVAMCVSAAIFLVSTLFLGKAWRVRRRQRGSDNVVTLQDMQSTEHPTKDLPSVLISA
ncbi:meprin A subunit beta-like [Platichthys flesus]|uniref:meprin A subunit beta-like n=1 Tax=Platichthys flesus TaxID=8260 RepID=UPI002DB91D52|nr:meprin A subunit beta-like [Platichthys flesus]